jgi:uncharacterized protein
MITVAKKDTQGHTKIQYKGEVLERSADGMVIQASWTLPTKDLGYTTFEPGDQFIEYYYTDRWFNIFDISSAGGVHKGWYCNVAEPAMIVDDHIEQVDLLLDVWVNPTGATLTLDEDEFAADTTLSDEQRTRARQGLQALLQLIAARQEMFSRLADCR